jgi:hypothetical protein
MASIVSYMSSALSQVGDASAPSMSAARTWRAAVISGAELCIFTKWFQAKSKSARLRKGVHVKGKWVPSVTDHGCGGGGVLSGRDTPSSLHGRPDLNQNTIDIILDEKPTSKERVIDKDTPFEILVLLRAAVRVR